MCSLFFVLVFILFILFNSLFYWFSIFAPLQRASTDVVASTLLVHPLTKATSQPCPHDLVDRAAPWGQIWWDSNNSKLFWIFQNKFYAGWNVRREIFATDSVIWHQFMAAIARDAFPLATRRGKYSTLTAFCHFHIRVSLTVSKTAWIAWRLCPQSASWRGEPVSRY